MWGRLTDQKNLQEEKTLRLLAYSNGGPWKWSRRYLLVYVYLDDARDVHRTKTYYMIV